MIPRHSPVIVLPFLAVWALFGLAFTPVIVAQAPTPTPPDPPRDTPLLPTLHPRPTNTPKAGGDDPTLPPGPRRTRTPTVTATLLATATLTNTATATLTPTPMLTYLDVLIYVDANQDGAFSPGEGAQGLWVVVRFDTFSLAALTQDGRAHYVLPATVPPGSDVQVQIPYLHKSESVRTARNVGESVAFELRLKAPHYPVLLP